jgi:hypothetical protein
VTQPSSQAPRVRRSPLRTNRLLIGLVVLLGFGLVAGATVVVIAVAGGAKSPIHPAGATVRDSWFAFRVAGVQARKRVTGGGGDATAKGRFVLVSLDVTDRDDKPWTVFADDQKLRAAGKTYGIDVRATVDVDKGPDVGLQKSLNPGETKRIVVVFDVPTAAAPQAVELHGAPRSDGVLVALRAA